MAVTIENSVKFWPLLPNLIIVGIGGNDGAVVCSTGKVDVIRQNVMGGEVVVHRFEVVGGGDLVWVVFRAVAI
ncbi:hypothetical protein SMSP1_00099 [Sedimentisphaera salicampi]|nr:hypothetical protein SMSP1_00099 [Sedimentisphaera salicampi]